MSSKKILVVFGATGNQGGSVINSILSDPITAEQFRITGITRDPSKPSALALANKGVDLVKVSWFILSQISVLTRHSLRRTSTIKNPSVWL
jgi:hypothetical protein